MDRLTFEMREAGAAVPTQLERTEISNQLRALVWDVLFRAFAFEDKYSRMQIRGDGKTILRAKHIYKDYKPADEFSEAYKVTMLTLKQEVLQSRFGHFYGLIEWFLRNYENDSFRQSITKALVDARAPFRTLSGDTLVPLTTDAELAAIEAAIAAAEKAQMAGAVKHFKAAAAAASGGRWADSIRDSIHAVESTAVRLEPEAKELGPALNKLEQKGLLHGGLKNGFKAIYGYTSDANGVRHASFDNKPENADEADALFMLGACASFVSYLIAKGQAAGLV